MQKVGTDAWRFLEKLDQVGTIQDVHRGTAKRFGRNTIQLMAKPVAATPIELVDLVWVGKKGYSLSA